MAVEVRKIFLFNKWLYFFLLVFMTIGINYFMNTFVITDDLFYNSFGEKIAYDRIEKFIHQKNNLLLISYCFVPIVLLLKIMYSSICISIGAVLAEYKITIIKAFKICLVAEIIFILANAIKMFYFLTITGTYSIEQIQIFYPLSLINILKTDNIPMYFIYPLQKINLFEVFYCMALTYGISILSQKPFRKSILFVLGSYGVGLLILIAFIVFLNINIASNV